MKIFAMLMASTAIGYMSETCEVVLATPKGGKGLVRVNKDEFDADQEKDAADRQYSKYSGKDEAEQSNASTAGKTFEELGVEPTAAPSAPDFSAGTNEAPLPIDPIKQAAAPSVAPPHQLLVMKEGSKFFVVNGMGEKVQDVAGIDNDEGYKSQKAAKDAIDAIDPMNALPR